MSTKEKKTNLFVGAFYQGTLFTISLLILIFTFSLRFLVFIPYEKIGKLEQTNIGETHKVYTGIIIEDLSNFHVEKNEFLFDMSVWFNFDASVVSIEKIKNFYFAHGELKYKSAPTIDKIGDRTFIRYKINLSFKDMLDFRKFPLDDHYILLKLLNKELPQDVEFRVSNDSLLIPKNLKLPGWSIIEKKSFAGFKSLKLTSGTKEIKWNQDQVLFVLGCERKDTFRIFIIIITLLLIILMANFPYSVENFELEVILALISFWFVTLQITPEHVGYFMLSDGLFIFCLMSTILSMLLWTYAKHENLNLYHKKMLVLIPYAFFVIASIILLLS